MKTDYTLEELKTDMRSGAFPQEVKETSTKELVTEAEEPLFKSNHKPWPKGVFSHDYYGN